MFCGFHQTSWFLKEMFTFKWWLIIIKTAARLCFWRQFRVSWGLQTRTLTFGTSYIWKGTEEQTHSDSDERSFRDTSEVVLKQIKTSVFLKTYHMSQSSDRNRTSWMTRSSCQWQKQNRHSLKGSEHQHPEKLMTGETRLHSNGEQRTQRERSFMILFTD